MKEAIIIEIPDRELPSYEKLTYQVKWLGLSVGTITASIKGIEKVGGRDAYVLEVIAQSNNIASKIYKVDDRFVSYMDTEHLYTLRHVVSRREGNYRKDAITDFDQENHKAYFKNHLDNSQKEFDIPSNVQDTLSACYYFMLIPVEVGDKIEYSVCNNEDNYQLYVAIESKTFVNLSGGSRQEAFLVQPYARLKGQEVRKGRVTGYFSCSKRRIPLYAIIKAPVFTSVTVTLTDVERRDG